MIPIQRSPLQQLVQEWIIQTRVREIPDISRRAGRSQRPVPGWRALYCNIPCQQAGKIYSESYLWTAEIRRLQLEGTGTQSESTVTFTVSQAAVLTATPSPAVTQTNQKSAVQTGDSTPIMTFVIILIVAVVCIGGILVYRRKKK